MQTADNFIICDDCGTKFATKGYLRLHRLNAKYCKKYKYVLFVCKKCTFTAKNLKEIAIHNEECLVPEPEIDPIDSLYNQIFTLRTNGRAEDKNRIQELETESQIREIKLNLYRDIIENNLKIKVDDLLVEEGNNISIPNEFIFGRLKLFLTDKKPKKPKNPKKSEQDDKQDDKLADKSQTPKTKKKKRYLPIKNSLAEKENTELNRVNFCSDFETHYGYKITTQDFEELYEKGTKDNQLVCISINNYLKRIRVLFEKTDNTPTILEKRLLQYPGYQQTHLVPEDVDLFRKKLELNEVFDAFQPFILPTLLERIMNPTLCFFTVREVIVRELGNKYRNGYHNVIYLDLEKSKKNDPYRFYTLGSVKYGVKYWKIDRRLVKLSENIAHNMVQYCIKLFSNIYKDIFGDNEYRKDYLNEEVSQLLEYDCEQLIQNIFILSSRYEICKMVMEIVKENASYSPTVNDKFDLKGDNSFERKMFSELKNKSFGKEIKENLAQLFDNISEENIVSFYCSKKGE